MFEPYWEYRLFLYMITGILAEFFFTSICNLINPNFLRSWNVHQKELTVDSPSWRDSGRDARALGYSFLWMLPIYMLMIAIEPTKELMSSWGISIWIRALIYVLVLWGVEYFTGWLIEKISGRCPWDYSASKWNLHGYIRWDFFPSWYGFMLFMDWLSGKFVELSPAIFG